MLDGGHYKKVHSTTMRNEMMAVWLCLLFFFKLPVISSLHAAAAILSFARNALQYTCLCLVNDFISQKVKLVRREMYVHYADYVDSKMNFANRFAFFFKQNSTIWIHENQTQTLSNHSYRFRQFFRVEASERNLIASFGSDILSSIHEDLSQMSTHLNTVNCQTIKSYRY